MGLLANLIARLGKKPAGQRRFNAAQMGRLTNGWTTQNTSANSDIRLDLEALRARARDLANNNDYAKKFLQMLETNVVGPEGFVLRSLAAKPDGSPDLADRKTVEDNFDRWATAGNCDVTARLSFADMQRLIIRAIGRDGEALIRRVRDPRFPHGYAQQILDVDRLDIRYHDELDNGNTVTMGVEYDALGAPAAYYLLTRHPGDMLRGGTAAPLKRERVPSSEIFHLFRPDRPEQVRGLPWMHTAMLRLQMLGAYEEAALVAARTGAAKMGFFTAPDGDGAPLADGETDQGEFLADADPGTFGVLPKGYEFQPFNPDYPQANYEIFVKACLRGIASGLGVAYTTLANDLEGVNFSSIRSGTLEERDNWMTVQKWFVSAYLIPTFNDWLEAALLAGRITAVNGAPLPAAKLYKFAAHTWAGRRWSWVDPLKDIEASLAAIRAGLNSPQNIAAQMGLDLEDVMEALAAANARASELGLPAYSTLPDKPPALSDTPAVKAAEIHAAAAVRAAELQRDQQVRAAAAQRPIHVDLRVDEIAKINQALLDRVAAHSRDTADDLARSTRDIVSAAQDSNRALVAELKSAIAAQPIVIPAPVVHVAAPVVNVEPPAVDVTVEATLPPAEVRVELPPRRTDTTIVRDEKGNIAAATQIETDV